MATEMHHHVERLAPELRRYLHGRLPAEDVDDVLQEVALRALQNSHKLERPERVRSWLYRITKNALTDHYRRSAREIPHDQVELVMEPPSPEPCTCASNLTKNLAPGQSQMVRLVDVESLSLTEAAQRAGSSVNAATVALHRGRKRLREKLDELCGATDYRSASTCECPNTTCESA